MSETQGEFIPIYVLCQHCRQPLKARRKNDPPSVPLEIEGLYDLEFRHDDGSATCQRVTYAYPFSPWDATAIYKKAVSEGEKP